MKHLLLLFTFLWTIFALEAQPCLPSGIVFTTQQEIDNFPGNYPGCTEIAGDVRIEGAIPNNITNLNGLAQITHFGGNLAIMNNSALLTLSGLQNVTSIDGSLVVWYCQAMVSLGALNKVAAIGGDFTLFGLSSLSSLYGLHNLASVGGNCTIYHINATGLGYLNNLTSIGGFLSVQNNPVLVNLNGLGNLISIGGKLSVSNNAALTSLSGLTGGQSNVLVLGGGIDITSNGVLKSVDGLENITAAGGGISVINNPALTDLNGLANLGSINGALTFTNNPGLVNFAGLDKLHTINGKLALTINVGLTSLSGLDNIDPTSINGLDIKSSAKLSTCEVRSICNYLANPANPASISGNASGCASRSEVETACINTSSVDPFFGHPDLKIYPNPVKGILMIEGIQEGQVVLVDYFGRVVHWFIYSDTGIDVSPLEPGMYFVRILAGDQVLTGKIVKE